MLFLNSNVTCENKVENGSACVPAGLHGSVSLQRSRSSHEFVDQQHTIVIGGIATQLTQMSSRTLTRCKKCGARPLRKEVQELQKMYKKASVVHGCSACSVQLVTLSLRVTITLQ